MPRLTIKPISSSDTEQDCRDLEKFLEENKGKLDPEIVKKALEDLKFSRSMSENNNTVLIEADEMMRAVVQCQRDRRNAKDKLKRVTQSVSKLQAAQVLSEKTVDFKVRMLNKITHTKEELQARVNEFQDKVVEETKNLAPMEERARLDEEGSDELRATTLKEAKELRNEVVENTAGLKSAVERIDAIETETKALKKGQDRVVAKVNKLEDEFHEVTDHVIDESAKVRNEVDERLGKGEDKAKELSVNPSTDAEDNEEIADVVSAVIDNTDELWQSQAKTNRKVSTLAEEVETWGEVIISLAKIFVVLQSNTPVSIASTPPTAPVLDTTPEPHRLPIDRNVFTPIIGTATPIPAPAPHLEPGSDTDLNPAIASDFALDTTKPEQHRNRKPATPPSAVWKVITPTPIRTAPAPCPLDFLDAAAYDAAPPPPAAPAPAPAAPLRQQLPPQPLQQQPLQQQQHVHVIPNDRKLPAKKREDKKNGAL